MTVWAVVPAKGFDLAKGRLAPLLAPARRQALAAALLADVLAALRAAPAVARVLVVSPDPAALRLAEALGATPLAEAPDGVSDAAPRGEQTLNAALDYASRVAIEGGATAVLTLAADLPLVTAADVAALIAAPLPPPAIVLAPSSDGGTSALLRQPPLAIDAHFGPQSLQAHLRAAAAAGVRARLVWRPNLALDVDRPDDLLRLADLQVRGETRRLLAEWRATATSAVPPPQHVGR